MKVNEFIKRVLLVEIMKGMGLTFKAMLSHAVTRQYPKEKREPFAGFRGRHALVRKPDGTAACVGCGLCAAVCPSQCITIHTSEGSDHTKVVDSYEIDALKCLFCALCVEACPYSAIALTDTYEYSDYSRAHFHFTKEELLDNWDAFKKDKKGKRYFEQFWKPRTADFSQHEDQAVFRGKPSESGTS